MPLSTFANLYVSRSYVQVCVNHRATIYANAIVTAPFPGLPTAENAQAPLLAYELPALGSVNCVPSPPPAPPM